MLNLDDQARRQEYCTRPHSNHQHGLGENQKAPVHCRLQGLWGIRCMEQSCVCVVRNPTASVLRGRLRVSQPNHECGRLLIQFWRQRAWPSQHALSICLATSTCPANATPPEDSFPRYQQSKGKNKELLDFQMYLDSQVVVGDHVTTCVPFLQTARLPWVRPRAQWTSQLSQERETSQSDP